MGSKLTPKVILEGIRLTFKTEIAFELNQHPRVVGPRNYRYHSPLISAEWCTFTNYPWGPGRLTSSRTLDIPDNGIPTAVERSGYWLEASGAIYMSD